MTEDLIFRFVGYDLLGGVLSSIGDSLEAVLGIGRHTATTLADGFNQVGAAAMGLGTGMIAAGAAVAFGMGDAAMAAANFQSQLTLLMTHAGASFPVMQQLGAWILQVAGQLGFNPTSLAEATYHVQSVMTSLPEKLRTVQNEEQLVYASAQLAAIGHADLEDSVNAVTKAFVVYGKDSYTASQITAIFNQTVGEGNMRLTDLNAAFSGGLLPVAEQAGLRLESLGAALATMTDEGIPAARAAIYLRSALIQMTIPTNAAMGALEAIGVAGNDASSQVGAFSEVLIRAGINQTDVSKELLATGSLGDTLTWLSQKLHEAGLNAQDTGALLNKAFGGIRSGTGIVTLYNNLNGLVQKEKDANNATKDWSGTWDKFTQSDPTFQLHQLEASWQTLVIILGYTFLPVALKVLTTITPIVTLIGQWIAKNSDLIASAAQGAVVFLLVGGAIVYVAGVIGRLIGFLLPIIEFFSELGEAISLSLASSVAAGDTFASVGAILATSFTGPIAIAIVAITALIAVGALLATHWQQVVAVARMVWGWVAPYVAQAVGYIRQIVQTEMGWIVSIWNQHHAQILAVATIVWTAIKIWFVASLVAIAIAIGIVIVVIAAVIAILVGLGAAIFWIIGKLMDLVGVIAGFVVSAWQALSGFFAKIISGASDAWSEFSKHPTYWLGYILGLLIVFAVKGLAIIISWFINLVVSAANGMTRLNQAIWNGIIGLPGDLSAVGSWMNNAWNQAMQWLETSGRNGASNVFWAVLNALKGLPGSVYNVGQDMARGLWSGIQSLGNWLKNQIAGWVDGLVAGMMNAAGIKSPSTVMAERVGIPLAQGVFMGMEAEFPRTSSGFNSLLQSLPTRISSGGSMTAIPTLNSTQNANITLVLDDKVLAQAVDTRIAAWKGQLIP